MKAELYNFKCWVNNSDPLLLKQTGEKILTACDFEVLGFMEHHFKPQGYTCIWLLGESHLAIHTYPEHNKSYFELTSCVKHKNEEFRSKLAQEFQLNSEEVSVSF